MKLIDTHTHLYTEAFDDDRNEAVRSAITRGVDSFFIPAIDSSYIEAMKSLEAAFTQHIYLMAGLHPTHVKENYKEELQRVAHELATHKYYGVGETGMDLYWDKTFIKEQKEAFAFQIALCKKYDLPLIIHCRDAFAEVFEVLSSEVSGTINGIFHCFTGSVEDAEKAIGFGLRLGIGGVVTFKNGKIDRFLGDIPMEHIVLETDAPYLAPVPYRGKRNESAYLPLVAEKVASVYNVTVEEVASVTTANALEVFRLK